VHIRPALINGEEIFSDGESSSGIVRVQCELTDLLIRRDVGPGVCAREDHRHTGVCVERLVFCPRGLPCFEGGEWGGENVEMWHALSLLTGRRGYYSNRSATGLGEVGIGQCWAVESEVL